MIILKKKGTELYWSKRGKFEPLCLYSTRKRRTRIYESKEKVMRILKRRGMGILKHCLLRDYIEFEEI